MDVACEFMRENTWAFAAVSSGDREELIQLSDKLSPLFPKAE
jgi:hypothetical protein